MARPLHDGNSSEPVGNIQAEASRTFPASGICEQNAPLSHRPITSVHSPPASCLRCYSRHVTHCQTSRGSGSNCEESGTSSSTFGQTRCHIPESFSTGETTACGYRHTGHENSGMEEDVRSVDQDGVAADAPRGELLLAGEEDIEREIAIRLRRIGDQMNELYMQRRLAGERQWWAPLRWHLTHFIYEILAALYNPLVDILPHN
ncbi:uncharacterized protein WCC33_015807 [Rhinophrynus dorsalis]